MKKRFLGLLGIIALVLMVAPAMAGTIDFEGMPDANYYHGGSQNIGNYYEGVDFQADATILDQAIYGYNNTGYPPHSGDAVMFSMTQGAIKADFDTNQSTVSLWYSAFSDFYLEAYNSSGVLLDSMTGVANYGFNNLLTVASAGDIAYVVMHDNGNYYTVDDFSCDSCTGNARVPEPSTLLLLGSSLLGLGYFSRRKLKG